MKILRVYQTKNPSYSANRSIDPIGILVHSTGAVNRNLKRYVDAEEYLGKNTNGNHWNKTSANKSVHAFIGYDKNNDVVVAQTLPYDRACWGCGAGDNGSYNRNPVAHIQFEICEGSTTDADYYWKAITVAEEYCTHLCKLYGWGVDHITSHREAHAAGYASNHADPHSWMKNFGDNMDKFRQRVAARLNGKNPPVEVPETKVEETPAQTEKTPETGNLEGKQVNITLNTLRNGSKGKQVKTVQRLLIIEAYDLGKYGADGDFGGMTEKAVKAFQKKKGLEADGIVGKNTWNALLK